MATLAEIQTVLNDPILAEKCRSACCKTAVAVNYEDAGTANHANRLKWAKKALGDPNGVADDAARYVVAAAQANNPSITLAELNALSDATIQSHVDASLSIFADGS